MGLTDSIFFSTSFLGEEEARKNSRDGTGPFTHMVSTCPTTELGELQDSLEPERLQDRATFVGTEKAEVAKVAKGEGAKKNRETAQTQ